MAGVIQVVPIGSAARSLVRQISEPLTTAFGFEVSLGQQLAEPKYAFNKDRQQHHSSAILRRLAPMRQMDQVGIVGIAEVDLFIPDANLSFVFGEADRNSKSALLSLARLRPEFSGAPQNNDLLRARARVELTHEVGHLVGLLHCQVSRCVMFFSTGVADTDRKGGAFCPDCQAELRRLGILKPANGASSP